jgi:hypothetical protein
MGANRIAVPQSEQCLVVERGDLSDLVRCPKAVEEVEDWHACKQSGCVADGGQVLRLLRRTGREKREPRHSRSHDVGVVAEDRKRVGRDSARRDVHAKRCELTRNLEEVGEHEQEPLRRGERRGERSRLQRSMDSASRTAFRLHLHHLRNRPPQVRTPIGGPRIGVFAHRGGRGDGVNGDDLAQPVCDVRHGLVGVERSIARCRDHVAGLPTRAMSMTIRTPNCPNTRGTIR